MQNSFTLKDPKVALGKPSKKENYKSELFKLAWTPPPIQLQQCELWGGPPPPFWKKFRFGLNFLEGFP